MGNALVRLPQTLIACSNSTNNDDDDGNKGPARLVNAMTAQVEHLFIDDERVKVAEVMLQNPGTFLMPFHATHTHPPSFHLHLSSLSSSFCFQALPADHELQHGLIYFLLPMHKLHKRASPQELSFLSHLAYNNTISLSKGSTRVSPCNFEGLFRAHNLVPSPSSFNGNQSPHNRFSPIHRSKSWKPNLQTITEAPANAGYGKHLTRLLSKGHLISTF